MVGKPKFTASPGACRSFHPVDVTDDGAVDADLGHLPLLRDLTHLIADFFQLTGIEPVTAAAGALVHRQIALDLG